MRFLKVAVISLSFRKGPEIAVMSLVIFIRECLRLPACIAVLFRCWVSAIRRNFLRRGSFYLTAGDARTNADGGKFVLYGGDGAGTGKSRNIEFYPGENGDNSPAATVNGYILFKGYGYITGAKTGYAGL